MIPCPQLLLCIVTDHDINSAATSKELSVSQSQDKAGKRPTPTPPATQHVCSTSLTSRFVALTEALDIIGRQGRVRVNGRSCARVACYASFHPGSHASIHVCNDVSRFCTPLPLERRVADTILMTERLRYRTCIALYRDLCL
jgi:hypothetical protein